MSTTTTVDPSFRHIQPGKANFLIWRIENFQLVPVPKDQHGTFYKGDSYLVYSCKSERGEAYVHFWLGKDSSKDEHGVAAYKAVELDDYLGGAAIQSREVQENESPRFMGYFRGKGLKYRDGGVASGFNHVDRDQFEPRLYQVKGKRYPRCNQVPIKWESFNDGDAFILDLGRIVFVWKGKEASLSETVKSSEVARGLRDDRGKGELVIISSGEENNMTDSEKSQWESYLPLSQRRIKSAKEGGVDENVESKSRSEIKLYRLSDSEGTLTVTEAAVGPLKYDMLDKKDVFFVDNGENGVWVWVGNGASKKERRESLKNALNFTKKKGYSDSTKVTRVVDGGEPEAFKMLFNHWPKPTYSGKTYTANRIATSIQAKFDVATMHENTQLARDLKLVDDGSGRVQIWRIEDFKMVPLDKQFFGTFYGGDCYIIFYTYMLNNRERHMIYYWLGRKSTADEQGTAALMAVKLDDDNNGEPVQVRVVQGKEPPHFMAIFDGKLIVFDGGKAGWTKGERDKVIGDSFLLRVCGVTKMNTKAVQVPLRGASLNSNDVFVLKTKTAVYVWSGKGCTGDEREMGKHIAKSMTKREPQIMIEGQEREDFWNAIGGREEYSHDRRLQEENALSVARLYHGTNAKGYFWVEEVPNFIQDDLDTEDVMILDTWDQVFVWIGSGANAEERKKGVETAIEYIKTDPSGRNVDETIILTVKQGFEPPTFTGFFPTWDPDKWSSGKSYDDLKKQFGDLNIGVKQVDVNTVTNGSNGTQGFSEVAKYSYEELKSGNPEGIRLDEKEIYLTEEDFTRVFKRTYRDFISLPAWKQIQLKKQVGLF